MFQKVIIVGRLGRDPEMRYTSGGRAVTSFSVATDRSWTDQNGQRQDRTTWFRVSVWGRQAESCNQYLAKGRMVLVEGEIQEPRVWQSRDGEYRASLELNARNVRFLGGRNDGGGGSYGGDQGGGNYGGGQGGDSYGGGQQGPSGQSSSGGSNIPPMVDEEEIPF